MEEVSKEEVSKEEVLNEEATVLIKQLLELAKCPICFNTLQRPVTLCASGHGVCKACHATLPECPICTKSYVTFKNRLLEDILELLPHECKHGCGEFVKVDDEHEKWCSHQSTRCKLCPWIGFSKDLFSHVYSEHATTPLLTEHNERSIHIKSKMKDVFFPMYVFRHFFWVNGKIAPEKHLFTMSLSLVPNGVFDKELEVKLEMKNGVGKYMVFTYLSKDSLMSSGDKVNCLSLHTSTLEDYKDQDGKVKYELSVLKMRTCSTNGTSLLQGPTDSPLNLTEYLINSGSEILKRDESNSIPLSFTMCSCSCSDTVDRVYCSCRDD